MPLVSVLTTCYKREHLLPFTINSVLASSWDDFEYIIVDDASPDRSYDVALEAARLDPRIKVFKNEKNLGDYPNRNRAASLATGKYIKFVDSDDIIYPHGLRVFVESMERFPEAGFGLSENGDGRHPFPDLLSQKQVWQKHFLEDDLLGRSPGSAIIKREAFQKVGGFSGRRFIGDAELWFKLATEFPMVRLVRDLTWDRFVSDMKESDFEARDKDSHRMRVQFTLERIRENSLLSSDEKFLAFKKFRKQQLKSALYRTYKRRTLSPLLDTWSLLK